MHDLLFWKDPLRDGVDCIYIFGDDVLSLLHGWRLVKELRKYFRKIVLSMV